jgi:probable F420-dependent oxidoreductase
MRFTVEYPIGHPGYDRRFLEPDTMTRFVKAVEDLGLDAVAFTEHPAPSRKWLDAGGHDSFDPLTALAFCAASTSRIRLMTYLLVLPYRNPLLAAKQISTTDSLSGGRVVVGVGGGYLRSEFAALGVDFDERNDLVDEALEVITKVWTTDSFAFQGRHFTAPGQALVPPPVQLPHPPIWIGGNSTKARERVAQYAQGWAPLLTEDQMAATTRTASIDSVDRLAEKIADLRQRVEAAGRDPEAIDVQIQWQAASSMEADPAEALHVIEQLGKAGVTWLCLTPPNRDADQAIDTLGRYRDEVVSQARAL